MMGQGGDSALPTCTSDDELSENVSSFFINKIATIRSALGDSIRSGSITFSTDIKFEGNRFTNLAPASFKELRDFIAKSPNKSCGLDPLPTYLLKQCVDSLLPLISPLINTCLIESSVPDSFKTALVRPLLKKPGLDKEVLKNYRPVSNLPFLSKVLEKIVAKRLETHLENNSLHDNLQSAYRRHHSTETALIRVHHDIASALDNNCSAVLVLLDLSAAFDVIDHDILLKRMDYTYGVSEDALSWIQSYLSHRKQCVVVGKAKSAEQTLLFGVPQGSVLGPRKYCLYSKPIGDICRRHNMAYHCYADDTQVYMVIRPLDDWDDFSSRLEICLLDISSWMSSNMLKLNTDKTELIVFRPKHLSKNAAFSSLQLTVGTNVIQASPVVRNLGVFFDSALTMEKQVASVVKSCFFQIRNIGAIRMFLTTDACKTLVHSLVTSRLDYGNGLLYGIAGTVLMRLQRVQNTAARLVTRTRKRDHISPVLKALHWLPVEYRCQYKVIMYAFNALRGESPAYLKELVIPYCPARQLRSQSGALLTVPKTRTVTYGARCFTASSATLWNNLPRDIRQCESLSAFKSLLKTHLFKTAF